MSRQIAGDEQEDTVTTEILVPTYIAHRLSRGNRKDNLRSAARWVAWLSRRYRIEPVCPWIVLASQWPESRRRLGLEIDLAAVWRCQVFIGVGPEWSTGMKVELKEFVRAGRFRSELGVGMVSLVGLPLPTTRPDAVDKRVLESGIGKR